MKMEHLYARYESIIPDFEIFMQYLKKPLRHSLRINTLKATREQILDMLHDLPSRESAFWTDAHIVDGKYHLGNHIAHNLGLIYVQEVASMIPVILLEPKPGEVVLDLCAAPGSKTTQIAQAMANQGLLVVNEVNRKRMRGLIHNVKRCGLLNEAVISLSGQKAYRVFHDYFDRILVDAPCSAEGTIRRSRAVLYHWGIKNIERMSRLQIGLAVSGFRALRPGGVMVYSTCTIAPEENEKVVSYLLGKFPEAELLPVRLRNFKTRPGVTEWQGVGFDPRVEECARILPQDNDSAPFFVAKLTKRGILPPRLDDHGRIRSDRALVSSFAARFGVEPERFAPYVVYKHQEENCISTPEVFSFREVRVYRKGLEFGREYDREPKPDNDMVQIFGTSAQRNTVDMSDIQVRKFLRGEIVSVGHVANAARGFVIIRYKDLVIGVGRYNGKDVKPAIRRERRTQ
ncbi:NOL1/NOP2/sun family putative RNA methylase [candidate division WOR-3 bacterium]|nr:NOL1/NOP2/sun family putative RNA methylase [candidate division WOR-3 bacterium]